MVNNSYIAGKVLWLLVRRVHGKTRRIQTCVFRFAQESFKKWSAV